MRVRTLYLEGCDNVLRRNGLFLVSLANIIGLGRDQLYKFYPYV